MKFQTQFITIIPILNPEEKRRKATKECLWKKDKSQYYMGYKKMFQKIKKDQLLKLISSNNKYIRKYRKNKINSMLKKKWILDKAFNQKSL